MRQYRIAFDKAIQSVVFFLPGENDDVGVHGEQGFCRDSAVIGEICNIVAAGEADECFASGAVAGQTKLGGIGGQQESGTAACYRLAFQG